MLEAVLSFVGHSLLWLLALVLCAVFPLSEFARGMASAPSQHPTSKGALAASLTGIVLLLLLIFG